MIVLCRCGCGEPAPIAAHTDRSKGIVKGYPLKFVKGHQARMSRLKAWNVPMYLEEDCGYKTPCWVWQRSTTGGGYGQIHIRMPDGRKKNMMAHRMMYEKVHGPIPDGLDMDHLCRIRLCVNPDHLQAVPGRINGQRAAWRAHGVCCPTCHRPF